MEIAIMTEDWRNRCYKVKNKMEDEIQRISFDNEIRRDFR